MKIRDFSTIRKNVLYIDIRTAARVDINANGLAIRKMWSRPLNPAQPELDRQLVFLNFVQFAPAREIKIAHQEFEFMAVLDEFIQTFF